MNITETLQFETLSKNKIKIPFSKLIAKHQRHLIINIVSSNFNHLLSNIGSHQNREDKALVQ